MKYFIISISMAVSCLLYFNQDNVNENTNDEYVVKNIHQMKSYKINHGDILQGSTNDQKNEKNLDASINIAGIKMEDPNVIKIVNGARIEKDSDLSVEDQIKLAETHPMLVDRKIRNADKVLDKVRLLTHDKILLTDSENQEKSDLINNNELIESYAKHLLEYKFSSNVDEDLQKRVYQLDFIRLSLQEKNELASKYLRAIINSELSNLNLSIRVKKYLVLEKIESLRSIKESDFENYKVILQNLPQNKINRYILTQI